MRAIGLQCIALTVLSWILTGRGGARQRTFSFDVVVLAHDIASGDRTFTAGTRVPLVQVRSYRVSEPHPPTCPDTHLHADTSEGIRITGEGLFPDPDPDGCGYGKIETDTIEIDDSSDDYGGYDDPFDPFFSRALRRQTKRGFFSTGKGP